MSYFSFIRKQIYNSSEVFIANGYVNHEAIECHNIFLAIDYECHEIIDGREISWNQNYFTM